MASTIDATIGGANANSYITHDAAQLYFNDRLNTGAWDTAVETDTADAALLTACRLLETESYQGVPALMTQPLRWPRYGVPKPNGWVYTSLEIPPCVLAAQCELALALLQDSNALNPTGMEGFSELQLGALRVLPRGGATPVLPALVRRILGPVLAAGSGVEVIRA